jgi:HEAT repeat protein
MSKRRLLWTVALAAFLLSLPFLLWGGYAAVGLVRGQHFYRGFPSGYWARVLRGLPDDNSSGQPKTPAWWEGWLPAQLNTMLADLGATGDPAVLKGDPAAVPVLTDLLRYPDVAERARATLGISRVGPPAKPAVPALLDALGDDSQQVRSYAAGALVLIHASTAEVMPAVRRLAERSDWAPALVMFELWHATSEAVPFLTQALHDPAPETRIEAVHLVRSMGFGNQNFSGFYHRMMSSSFDDLRAGQRERTLSEEARAALVVPLLLAAALDRDEEVRHAVAAAVNSIDPAATALVQSAHDLDPGVRWEGLRVLLQYCQWSPAMADGYLVLWADPDPDVREWARTHQPQERQSRATLAAALRRRAKAGPLSRDMTWLLRWMQGSAGEAGEDRP